jgi:eukaryotic-like serine/threonine-protein kinase
VPTGHIVYALGTTLLAVPFDVKTLQVTGGPAPIIEGVRRASIAGSGGADAQFAFSNNGSMVYIPGGQAAADELALVLVDRAGTRKPLNVPPGPYWYPRVSPNGKQLTVFTNDSKESIVWTYELAGVAPLHRLTFGGRNQFPFWTRDGQRIVFQSDRDGDQGLFWQRADGSGSAERLVKAEPGFQLQPESWSPDGKVLIFDTRRNAAFGIAMLSTDAGQKPIQVMTGPAGNSSLSQDGRWLAYNANGPGNAELQVYVEPFPLTGAKYQITTSGGQDPVWSPDGKQLFYLRADGTNRQIMSVDIQTQPSFAVGKTTPLPIEGIIDTGPRSYDITPDGKYFVVMVAKSQVDPTKASSEQFNVTLNWFEELKQRVPVK